MGANLRALRERAPESDAIVRYATIAQILTGKPDAEAGIEWVEAQMKSLTVPRLARWGVTPEQFDSIAEKAAKASSMKANPLPLTPEELKKILAAA
jgi:alcohol dehydrogenase class IV